MVSGTDVVVDTSVVDVSLGLSVVDVTSVVVMQGCLEIGRPPVEVFSAGLVPIRRGNVAFVLGTTSSGAASDKVVGVISIISTTVTDMSDEIVEVIGSAVVSRVPSAPIVGSTMIVV